MDLHFFKTEITFNKFTLETEPIVHGNIAKGLLQLFTSVTKLLKSMPVAIPEIIPSILGMLPL
jgi:hypothetical protein